VSAGLALVGLLLLAVAGLMAWGGQQREARETQPASALAPARGRWVEAGDARLFIQEWGPADGPMLLLSHGTGAWSGTWFDLPDTLAAAGWRVVAVDLPPFGFSRTHAISPQADYRRSAQARRLLALINVLGSRPVTLVGHSFGAGPALEAALLGGERLRQLVLVDPALGLGAAGEPPACAPPGPADALLAHAGLRRALIGGVVTQPRFTATLLGQFVFRTEAVNAARVPAYQRPFGQIGFSDRLGDWARVFAGASCESAGSLGPAALTAWAERGPPLTLIWGEQDSVTPLAQGQALKRWMPRAELVTLPGVGHIPHIEDPAAFAQALLAAIKRP
jgi:pimeloyl-ACP methyl ester carboxylesterase